MTKHPSSPASAPGHVSNSGLLTGDRCTGPGRSRMVWGESSEEREVAVDLELCGRLATDAAATPWARDRHGGDADARHRNAAARFEVHFSSLAHGYRCRCPSGHHLGQRQPVLPRMRRGGDGGTNVRARAHTVGSPARSPEPRPCVPADGRGHGDLAEHAQLARPEQAARDECRDEHHAGLEERSPEHQTGVGRWTRRSRTSNARGSRAIAMSTAPTAHQIAKPERHPSTSVRRSARAGSTGS